MNKYLEQLIELSSIDKSIDGFGPRVQTIEKSLKISLEKENKIKADIKLFQEEIEESNLKKSKNEVHLAELSEKLQELSKKSSIVKTVKEVKSLQLEEEIAKEQCDFANEEIERLENYIESRNKYIEEENAKLEEVSKEVQSIRDSIAEELASIDKEREEVYEHKQKLVPQIDQKILTFYEKIRKWAGNTAVAPVKKQACYGCFMRLNDKVYSSVIKQEDIVTCPHCGRILYKETQENE
ncbi:MAG: C4-type zinc ribbon domain-containing protein [Sulfurospirillaceae bacterium]|nr:C4-type zinc ribbon domain-containing protein [Sulfurospirillaceae bacterium]